MKRAVLILSLMILGMIFLFPLISSANTINITHPLPNASMSGTFVISGILDTNTLNLSRAWFYIMLQNSTNITLAQNTINQSNHVFNYSLDTTTFYDIAVATIHVTIANETGNGTNTTDYQELSSIDNGNPTATYSTATASADFRGRYTKDTITYGLSADNTIGISSCRVILTDKQNGTVTDTTTTTSANACSNTTITCYQVGKKGKTYDVRVQATDGNGNRTNSSARVLSCLTDPAVATDSPVVSGGGGVGFFKAFGNFFKSLWDVITFWN